MPYSTYVIIRGRQHNSGRDLRIPKGCYRLGVVSRSHGVFFRNKLRKNGGRFIFSAPFSAESRITRSQRRAHAYSVARIANPTGITTRAGPGSIIMATPIKRTVIPTIKITMRRAYLIIFRFYRFIQADVRARGWISVQQAQTGCDFFNVIHNPVHAKHHGLERFWRRHIHFNPLQ